MSDTLASTVKEVADADANALVLLDSANAFAIFAQRAQRDTATLVIFEIERSRQRFRSGGRTVHPDVAKITAESAALTARARELGVRTEMQISCVHLSQHQLLVADPVGLAASTAKCRPGGGAFEELVGGIRDRLAYAVALSGFATECIEASGRFSALMGQPV